MTRQIHRIGDANTGGGVITTTPQTSVFVNNRLVAVNGSRGFTHGTGPHSSGAWQTQNGSDRIFINNMPVNRSSDADSCGHSRAVGSTTVFMG